MQTPASLMHYCETTIQISSPLSEMAVALVDQELDDDYAIYEINGEWWVAIGAIANIHARAGEVTLQHGEQIQRWQGDQLCALVSSACAQIPVAQWKAYGSAKFELAYQVHGVPTGCKLAEDATLLSLFVPRLEVRFSQSGTLLRATSPEQLHVLQQLLQNMEQTFKYEDKLACPATELIAAHDSVQYKERVAAAVQEIADARYLKVILSRNIPLHTQVDMPATYLLGRRHNSPARSFLMRREGVTVAGFSPETVVEVDAQGLVTTQPLAGTRSMGQNSQEEIRLRQELLADAKEIVEHVVSVKLAVEELEQVCEPGSVNVSEFMGIKRRGSVQHLASRVKGQLKPDQDAWSAFAVLFPAVTASGIPKREAIDAIARHESIERGLYSGCIMVIDSRGEMDAALVLRSLYQQDGRCWLHAGAGIVAQSSPERELEETIEKLSCIARYIVPAAHATQAASLQLASAQAASIQIPLSNELLE